MKKVFKIGLSVLIIIVLIIAGGLFYLSRGLESGSQLEIGELDLTSLDDGSYTGSYHGGRWTNEVTVVVKDHKISDIKVVKDVTFARAEVTSDIISKVLESQQLNVDIVSGMTVTSKAYLKAIENALKNQ